MTGKFTRLKRKAPTESSPKQKKQKKHRKQKKDKKQKKQKKQSETENRAATQVSPFSLEAMLIAQQQPRFSGLESDLDAFLADYERFGSRCGWSKADLVDRLKMYVALELQTPVSRFCWPSNGESPPIWEQTKSWLWSQFGGGTLDQRLDKASQELEAKSSHQKPNESVDTFRRRFDALVDKINRLRSEWNSAASTAGFQGERPPITSVQRCDFFMRRLKRSIFQRVHDKCTSTSGIDEVVKTVKRMELTQERFEGNFGCSTPQVQFAAPEATSLNVTTVGVRREVQTLRDQLEELKSALPQRSRSPTSAPRSPPLSLSAATDVVCMFCNGAHDKWACDRFCVSCGSASHTYPSCNVPPGSLDCDRCHGRHGTNVCPYPLGKYPPWLKNRRRQRQTGPSRSPRRQTGPSGGVCFYFRDTGSCPFGDDCRFRHGRQGSSGNSSRRGSRRRSRGRSESPEPPLSRRGSSRTESLLNQIISNQQASSSSGDLASYVRAQREMVRKIMSDQGVDQQEATDALNSITSQ